MVDNEQDEARQAEEDALCDVLRAADDVLRAKAQLQASLKEGWFCLARARYQMGAASVSQLQYDQNMSACVVLQPCTSDSSDAPTTWALHRVYEPEQDHASTLRRRKTASDATDAAASRASSLGQLPAAPLRWFAGAMPPVVLKAAQQHFWRALESVVDAANAQAKLRHLPVPVPAARQTAEDNTEPLSESIAGEADGGSEEVACILEKMGLHLREAMSSEARAQQEGEGAEDEWTDTASAAIS